MRDENTPERTVFCEDALVWLDQHKELKNCSLIASMPDISEFPKLSLHQWQNWFQTTAKLILSRCPDDGVTIFYQSDIKVEGAWVDKGYICQKAAEELGHTLLWHKIVCRTRPGIPAFGRPAFSHLLCFSEKLRLTDLSRSTADVVPELGEKTWQRGMGLSTSLMIAKFILEQTSTKTIVNPFCGEGSMLAAANCMGLAAIGIERSPKRAEKARNLRVSADHKSWIKPESNVENFKRS